MTTDTGPCKGRTIRRTDSRTVASCIAKEQEVVVLPEAHVTKGGCIIFAKLRVPTPPFPPTSQAQWATVR